MKKTTLVLGLCLSVILAFCPYQIIAQCYLLQDSVIAGEAATRYKTFRYDMNWRIIGSEIVDSAQTTIGRYDTIFYAPSGLVDSIVTYNIYMGTPYWSQTTFFTYNGFNQISRMDAYGTNNSIPWAMSHDLYYNGSGNELSSAILDTASVVGNPEGLDGSFDNIVWANGNPVSLNLVANFSGALDTFELLINFDNKNNRRRLEYITGMGGILEFLAQNNLISVVLANNESIGNAGTAGLSYSYTYNANDEVETTIEYPGLFNNQDSSVHQYKYDCATAIQPVSNVEDLIQVYPNPFDNQIFVDFKNFNTNYATISLTTIDGKIISNQTIENPTFTELLGLENLPAGVYILTIQTQNQIISKKLIK